VLDAATPIDTTTVPQEMVELVDVAQMTSSYDELFSRICDRVRVLSSASISERPVLRIVIHGLGSLLWNTKDNVGISAETAY